MRSRYTAYTLTDIDYLTQSLHPEARHDHDPVAARRWAEHSSWLGLEVLSVQQGGERDEQGQVEFVARYKDKNGLHRHHEIAHFLRQEGVWYYREGSAPKVKTQARDLPKVGRNDPCPCGSGHKYKKCCGAH